MLRYTLIRIIWISVILVTILSVNFVILQSAPKYPPTEVDERDMWYARQVSDGYFATWVERDEEIIRQLDEDEYERKTNALYLREEYTDQETGETAIQYRIWEPVPIPTQYFRWVRNILTDWNWGVSTTVSANRPVFDILAERIPVTVRLNIVALIFYIPVGFGLGIWAALKKNSLADNIISVTVMIFISIPSFVIMLLLVLTFGYQLDWLPRRFPPANATGAIRYTSMVLPVLGLSFGSIAGLTRLTRAELTEVLTSEFLLLARTKGLTRPQSVVRHAMRNSMVPLVPSVIASFVGLLSGSVIIEQIYSIPGTGRIFIQALEHNNYDYNLILGITAFYTVIGLFAVLLVDLSYGIVDPRIRMGARK